MSLTKSTTISIGSPAAAFSLPDTRNGDMISLSQFDGQPLFIAFICNHCPYVVHLLDALADTANVLAEAGIATVAISANDAQSYPADSPQNMQQLAADKGFAFPYCHDETQQVARAYEAVCTPDLYLFDQHHALFYRGQFDSSRPGHGMATGEDLRNAATAMLDGHAGIQNGTPSVGCSIKWKR